MEKRQNKLIMRIIKPIFILLLSCYGVFGQDNLQLDSTQKQYILGGIELSGDQTLDKKSVLKLMNLKIGQKIEIPSEDLKKGLKTLWDQGLFSDIQIHKKQKDEKAIILDIYLEASASLLKFKFNGIKKGDEENIRKEIDFYPGMAITPNVIMISKQKIENYFIDKGFSNANCIVKSIADTINKRKVTLEFNINKNERVKIKKINFLANTNVKSSKLKKVMKDTRETGLKYLLSSSKLIEDNYETDLNNIINFYKQKGYPDASIVTENIEINDKNQIILNIKISEGEQYFFGDITWLGNTKYDSNKLSEMLGIRYGDVFDATLLDSRLNMSQNGDDISALYMDDGYLFFQVNPVEISIKDGNFINLEMQMREGNQAIIKNVSVKGNTKTNDHVIMREMRSLPGQLFKRSDIIRTQEELNRLGFFNPEALGVNPMPDPQTGNVDIEYVVEEKPGDQIEMSGGYGAGRFVGQVGVTFSNFSTKGIKDKTTWSPLPTGDGQRVQLNAQFYGTAYQTYRALFQEPWLGGKRPNSFTTSLSYSQSTPSEFNMVIDDSNISIYGSNNYNIGDTISLEEKMEIIGFSIGLGKRLKWPDDYFTIHNSFNIDRYNIENWQRGGVPEGLEGVTTDINFSTIIKRSSVFNPIYPRSGSTFSFGLELTPPYSLFNNKDYANMELNEKFELLEYYKIKTSGEWYSSITGNLVLKTRFEFGFLSAYNDDIGDPPFGKFFVGGDMLQQSYSLFGRDNVGVRGYDNEYLLSYPNSYGSGSYPGMPVYSKYVAELRYPISLNPATTIYALCFLEAANAWESIDYFKPFEVKRAAGLGVRIFMPMFGLIGVDFGYGFDYLDRKNDISGLVTQLTIGQQF